MAAPPPAAALIASLREHPPFDEMGPGSLQFLAERLRLAYYARGTLVVGPESGKVESFYAESLLDAAGMLAALCTAFSRLPVSCPSETPVAEVLKAMHAARVGSDTVEGLQRAGRERRWLLPH